MIRDDVCKIIGTEPSASRLINTELWKVMASHFNTWERAQGIGEVSVDKRKHELYLPAWQNYSGL